MESEVPEIGGRKFVQPHQHPVGKVQMKIGPINVRNAARKKYAPLVGGFSFRRQAHAGQLNRAQPLHAGRGGGVKDLGPPQHAPLDAFFKRIGRRHGEIQSA